jgi:hypothetical protein
MVHYREFSVDANPAVSPLEGLARSQLSSAGASGTPRWQSISDRVMGVGDGSGFELVLNRVADLSSAVFGEMCLIHPTGVQALLELTAHKHQLSTLTLAEIYDLTERGAPKGMHYVRGLAYFLAVGNHLFFIRTQSLTPTHIQSYIEWLLKVAPGAVPPAAPIHIESKFDRSAMGGNIGDIKALRVSGPSFPQMSVTPTTDEQVKERATTRKVAEKFVQFGQAFEVAKAVLGEAKATSLAESLGPKERLVVDATVKVRGTRTEASKARLKNLASELDSLTDGKIVVEGKDGKFEDKDVILRTNMPFDLDKVGTSLLNFDNVADQLQKVYGRFVEDGKIKA